jgi:broad specificity phosphatase PhoE
MTQIFLIRHGEAAAGWGQDLDPPLSKLGKKQALDAAQYLFENVPNIENFQCLSSPIKRAHETAQAFADISGKKVDIQAKVAEIPSPIDDVHERMPWLMNVMQEEWQNLSPLLNDWRQSCIDYISSLQHDSVIFSHYIAINVIIGHCQQDNKVISYYPDNCSIHHFENSPELHIVKLGKQAKTKIN